MPEQSITQSAPSRSTESTPPTVARQRMAWDEWAAIALLLIAFAPTLPELVREWVERPEFSHGFLMPIIAGAIVYSRREQLWQLPRRDSILGWGVVAFGLLMLLLGEMKLSFYLKPVALCVSIGGLVWAFRGWRGLRAFAPALVPLLLMCPLPGRVERDLTIPLKNIAALLATGMLNLTGIGATLEGNTIHILGIDSLLVAEACSGIRSLISLGSISLLAAVFWDRPLWQRVLVVLASIPVAVSMNSLRIWLTGFISVHGSAEMAQGVFHFLEGFVLFAISALILLGFALALDLVRSQGGTR